MKQQIIETFIRENRTALSREEITTSLLQSGYSKAEIDQAWRSVQVQGSPTERLLSSPRVQHIAGYIHQTRNTYTREAITRKILEEGYSQDEINAAWAAIGSQEISRPRRPVGPDWHYHLGTLVGVWIVSFGSCIIWGLWLSGSYGFELVAKNYPASYTIGNVLFWVTQLGAFAAGAYLLTRGERVRNALALVVTVNFVWFFVILGTCLSRPSF